MRRLPLVAFLFLMMLLTTGVAFAQQEPLPLPPEDVAPEEPAPPPDEPRADLEPLEVLAPPEEAPVEPPVQPVTQAPAPETANPPAGETSTVNDTIFPAEPVTGGIMLNFKDASLDMVLDYLSEAAGFVVIKGTAVEGRISIVSRQPLSADEAVGVLNTVLKEKGYTVLRTGRTLKVVALTEARKANVPVRSGNDPAAIEPTDQVVTQVIPLRFVDAVRLKQDIATLIPTYADLSSNASSNTLILTDTEANIRRVVEIVKALDTQMSSVDDVKVFQLVYANATSAARLINDVFKPTTISQQAGMNRGGRTFGPGGANPNANANAGTDQGRRGSNVVASSDDRTNTVVVTGPTDVLQVVAGVIAQLDANPNAAQDVFTYRLKNSKAANMQTVLNNLFSGTISSATGARGSTAARTAQNRTAAGQSGTSAATQGGTDLSGQVFVVADGDTNSLMVMTASKNFDRVREIIAELDKAVPQVLIKVLIAEVTHTDKTDLGAEFSILNLSANGNSSHLFTDFGVAASGTGLIYKLVNDDVTAALHALETVGKLNVLSRPYILGSDNQAANITVGQRVPFITASRTTDTGQTINTITYEDIGIILNVTPHINPEGLVIMDIAPEISTLTGDSIPISEGISAPTYANRSATSHVAIHDGQTIVIGGLMEDKKTDTVRKVPLLGSLPLLGALFRHTIHDTSKTELLIFITPHVAKEPGDLKGMAQDEVKGTQLLTDDENREGVVEHLKGMKRGAAPEGVSLP